MSDLISRQDALDALKGFDVDIIPYEHGKMYVQETINAIFLRLSNLPSAEPEVKIEAEKMPTTNMTILHRKIDLLSILQAIKSDKIRVWMSYDGKIRFRNTKTGNEIEVNPYYDMEGEKYHE